jgi:cytochrome c-type biogenesis protein CcmH
MRRLILLATATLALGVLPPAAGATAPRASLTDIENDVMCISCREPLAVAQSPQALAERDFIRTLIARGYSKRQIEAALVAQYGTAVLGRPPARGFNLTVYILPPALLAVGLALLAYVLPRWRRRARAAAAAEATSAQAPPLPAEAARRVEEELAAFDG